MKFTRLATGVTMRQRPVSRKNFVIHGTRVELSEIIVFIGTQSAGLLPKLVYGIAGLQSVVPDFMLKSGAATAPQFHS